MIPAEIIKLKRSGSELSPQQIQDFVTGYLDGTVADYQMSAFLMAVFFKGMTPAETFALTDVMLHSGSIIDLSAIEGAKVDKHSTGGVGDKTSLVIGPMVAAAGIKVPMISGRGLGHTGGTLDKLESMKGFNIGLSLSQFQKQISDIGICFIGQTADICPADKRMYALRDVTATVESIPLISASIMSKKLAEGADGLVLDVKFGRGAFMKTPRDAELLAKSLINIARKAGKKVSALITNMDQPLGAAVGNALEVQECLDVMEGHGPKDMRLLCVELAAHMICLGGKVDKSLGVKNLSVARKRAQATLDDGSALEIFKKMVARQGGSLQLPRAAQSQEIKASKRGFITRLDAEAIGFAGIVLKAGRLLLTDPVDPSAGIVLHKKIGDTVIKGETLATLFYNSNVDIDEARRRVSGAYEIRLQKVRVPHLIKKVMGA